MDVQERKLLRFGCSQGTEGPRNDEPEDRHGPNAIDAVTAIANHVIDPAGEF